MQADFWHERWAKGETAFHEKDINPLLNTHFSQLNLVSGQRVFVPLCGKTHDISWLLQQGYSVVAAELSEVAIKELFSQLGFEPQISNFATGLRYQGPNLDIFVGDIFTLNSQHLGHIAAVYDRAALVALPEPMRKQYTQHIRTITQHAPQLLICFNYEQAKMDGPPFSVTEDEVKQHYAQHYRINRLYSESLVGGLKGKVAALQQVWLLQNKVS
ncbi:thiopurine S-methyltransferase [Paraglaciecola sp. 25GB23A]|uniref:thiopurine S-methyltransferase n=1 Tax=Paraglaciecola sp. 25GB23A TaxID=3156068 RepID=UPI0032B00116